MIPDFSNQVQKDIVTLTQERSQEINKNREETEKKVGFATIRAIGALAMAFGTILTIAAMPYVFTSTLAFVFFAAVGVAAYVAGHDVFVFGLNAEKMRDGYSLMQGLRQQIASFKGNDKNIEERLKPFTDGMILQTFVHQYMITESKKQEAAKSGAN
jgi:hypothetical protein